jgi:NADPH2:quinone reductase
MPHIIRVEHNGGPEVMQWVELPAPDPAAGEVRIRQKAVGVNFLDVYYRKGVYPPPAGFPFVPGSEGAGVVDAVGAGVTEFKVGDRVAYFGAIGAYAEVRTFPANRCLKIPDGIEDRTLAAGLLKGLTAETLLHRVFKVGKGTTILFHAAAGGVGSIACQWAVALGATVIGTVGSDEKIEAARSAGCQHVINYRSGNFVEAVKAITGGAGVDVVYDSIGNDTFPGSLDCLKHFGMWVSFGQSSGLPPPFQTSLLQSKGSLFATRPTINNYLAKRAALESAAANLFAVLKAGTVTISIGQEFALKDAADAHRALEARQTVGTTVLIP